jgi:molybdopterin/thiamine biosynthesis adenylyltransferase/proteasome lid subunit RPN8/RPN11
MILRVIESEWNDFADSLCARTDVETAGVILAERLHGNEVLLARDMIEIPPEGYLIRRQDHVRLDPVTFNRLIRPARDRGLSVITIHTHPGTREPWFSTADDNGDARLVPSLFNQMSGPHGSVVIAGETGLAAGRVWSESGEKQELGIRIIGRMIRSFHSAKSLSEDVAWFDRQRLALGQAGQETLRDIHAVIVGLGGTGSVVFLQLAHLGVRRITVIDGDIVANSNVSRILGAMAEDAGRTWKVDVAAHYADRLGIGTEVRCLRGHFGKDISPEEIEGCDVVLSCVDRHLPRAVLNRLSYEKAIPVIDMGSAFRVGADGRITAGSGRVVVVGPGRRCLACWGHIDSNRMRVESLSEKDRTREIEDGYIDGAEVAQPSVVAFNTAVAGAAVVEFMRLVTAFAGADNPPMRLSFDFETGTVRRNCLAQEHDCRICLPKSSVRNRLTHICRHSSERLISLANEVIS